MKRSILDFDQQTACAAGISAQHLVFLDWFVYWYATGNMKTVMRHEHSYAWIDRQYVREQLPILGFKHIDQVSKLLTELCSRGFLDRVQEANEKKKGSKSYYRPTAAVAYLRDGDQQSKSSGGTLDQQSYLSGGQGDQQSKSSAPHTPSSSSDTPSSNTPTGQPASRKNGKPFATEFEQVWKMYPRKVAKQKSYKAFLARRREGVSIEELARATQNYRKQIEHSGTEERFTMHGATFYGPDKRYEDYNGQTQERPPDTRRVCSECGKKDPNSTSGSCMFCGGAFEE